MAHGFFTSGMLPTQYEKFCEGSGIGKMGNRYLNYIQNGYSKVVSDLSAKSKEDAIMEEIASSVAMGMDDGIAIMTDARHCWRKNARFSDVVCLGENSHKVLNLETVSKDDDPVTQRHELFGIKKIYEDFDNKHVPVKVHAHDNNPSVTKFVRERGDTENANDTWHMSKKIAKDIRKITSGPKKLKGKTWHHELSDKAGSIRTHIYFCLKNCDGDPQKLKSSIDNNIPHYKRIHEILDVERILFMRQRR